MMYLQMGVMMLISMILAIAVIPLVWFGLVLVPLVLLLLTPFLALAGWAYGSLISDAETKRLPKVLLIDNELDSALMVQELLVRYWSIKHVGSSFRGIGKVLENNDYDYLAIRWTRRKLSGESILDYLDSAIRIHNSRQGGREVVQMPPVVFLRRPEAAGFEIKRPHLVSVIGCVSLERDTFVNEVHSCLRAV